MKMVFLGLSLTSSWGNGHATTYRALLRALAGRGHDVVFLERDVPWYAPHRDLDARFPARVHLYENLDALDAFRDVISDADVVVVGSYVPDGPDVLRLALRHNAGTCFYDIDTPVTLAALRKGDCAYLTRDLIPRVAAYFSFSGGPTPDVLRREFKARRAVPLYCSVDPELYLPPSLADSDVPTSFDLSYLGTYSPDRRPTLDALLVEPARLWPAGRFCVAGPQYPDDLVWPANVKRVEHVPPSSHARFYAGSRLTLNVTRRDMRQLGWSPSVRLFEAAACGTPILSDTWPGLSDFFTPGGEILTASTPADALRLLRDTPDAELRDVAAAARARVLASHTSARRAEEFERYVGDL